MPIDRLSGMTQAQRDRLAFVELRLRFVGEIRRQDLITRFDIQAAAATRDIAQYKELAPRNMEYDPKGKVYVRAPWFRPLFDFSAGRVLVWLSQGYGDAEPARFGQRLVEVMRKAALAVFREPVVGVERLEHALDGGLDLLLLGGGGEVHGRITLSGDSP